MLIIVCGLPGSGKSTLSKKLRVKIGAVYLNTDIIRKQILDTPKYSEEEKNRIYTEMANIAEKNLNQGKNVIVDATFSSKKYRDLMKRITKNYYLVYCELPEYAAKSRLEKRKERNIGVSDAGFDVYLKMKEKFEKIEDKHFIVDCTLSKSKQVQMVLDYIGGKND